MSRSPTTPPSADSAPTEVPALVKWWRLQEVKPIESCARVVRKLKVEADGDSWKGNIKPKVRLTGRWLERAGFRPGSHVHVTFVAPGVMELRSCDAPMVNETKQS